MLDEYVCHMKYARTPEILRALNSGFRSALTTQVVLKQARAFVAEDEAELGWPGIGSVLIRAAECVGELGYLGTACFP